MCKHMLLKQKALYVNFVWSVCFSFRYGNTLIMQNCYCGCEAVVFTQTCRQLGLVLCCVCIVLCVYCVSHNMCLLYVVLLFCDLDTNMPSLSSSPPLPPPPPLPAIASLPLHSSSPLLNPLTPSPLPSPSACHPFSLADRSILPPPPSAPPPTPPPAPPPP